MPAITSSAPGKIILFGEHAVVYNRPALAVPFSGVKAKATAFANPIAPSGQIKIEAPDVKLQKYLHELPDDNPLSIVIHSTWEMLGITSMPSVTLRITSTIPPAAGLGSSAAVAVALARTVSSFVGHPLPVEKISQVAFQAEQRLHGNPSGIDNTVISYAQPIYFMREKPFEVLSVNEPFMLIVANTGVESSTADMVKALRQRWQSDPDWHESLFDRIAEIVNAARDVIEKGNHIDLGPLMTQNHLLLQELGISCPELDQLVDAAINTGAIGAKLSGGGGGGNMISLIRPEDETRVSAALHEAGAIWVKSTIISPQREV